MAELTPPESGSRPEALSRGDPRESRGHSPADQAGTGKTIRRQFGHPNLQQGGSPGRPAGVPNKATQEMKAFARALTLENPKYVANLRRRLEAGKCHPSVEVTLLHYGYGKPAETIKTGDRGAFVVAHMYRPPGYDPLAKSAAETEANVVPPGPVGEVLEGSRPG